MSLVVVDFMENQLGDVRLDDFLQQVGKLAKNNRIKVDFHGSLPINDCEDEIDQKLMVARVDFVDDELILRLGLFEPCGFFVNQGSEVDEQGFVLVVLVNERMHQLKRIRILSHFIIAKSKSKTNFIHFPIILETPFIKIFTS